MNSNKEVKRTEAKFLETNELFEEKLDESNERKNNANEDKEQIQDDTGNVVRTYILVGCIQI